MADGKFFLLGMEHLATALRVGFSPTLAVSSQEKITTLNADKVDDKHAF